MANEVIIEKFNEAYIKVRCEPSTAKELNEFFKFEVPGAKFMPSVRNRTWSGYIHLFSPATGKIYTGLLPYVQRFLQEQGYRVKVEDVFRPKEVDKKLIRRFVSSVSKFRARAYQIDAIHYIIERDRGVILSPTGSGKSFIIYALIRWYIEEGHKILLVVPTTSLVEQTMGGSLRTTAIVCMLVKIKGPIKMLSSLLGSPSTNNQGHTLTSLVPSS